MATPPNQSSIIDQLEKARNTRYVSEDGESLSPEFFSGISENKLQEIESQLGAPLPADLRELMTQCAGIDGLVSEINFTGSDAFGMEEIFPHCHTIAADGLGNFWIVDVLSKKEATSAVFFACHDAPVILHQCGSMKEFLAELIRMYTPPFQSLLNEVHDDRLHQIWRNNPGTLNRATALNSADPTIRSFASTLDERYHIVDLRSPQPGMGFSWGRFGPRTELRRCGEERIFACAQPHKQPGFFSRLFGKTSR